MQKLNWKYFTGSFFLSLVAVFIATKAYIVMSLTQAEPETTALETKNIELFAATEENDPIYEKYKKLSAAEAPLGVATETPTVVASAGKTATPNSTDGEILYAENSTDDWIKDDENFAEKEDINILSTTLSTAAAEPTTPTVNTAENSGESDELQIADASGAPNFAIPLKHNFKIETGVVSVSDEADSGRIALASKNVSIYNLGTENTAAVTEPLDTEQENENLTEQSVDSNPTEEVYSQNVDADDAWDVAETSNKHINRNTFGVKSEPLQHDVTLPDAQPSEETKVSYKATPNILIPIPEDILNDENLTPQFSTSKENLLLEQDLRNRHQLPELLPEEKINSGDGRNSSGSANVRKNGGNTGNTGGVIQSIDDEKDFDSDQDGDDEDDEEVSRGYLDSINSFFKGIRNKSSSSTGADGKPAKAGSDKSDQHSSIFQRLFKKDEQQNIVPTELKLSFQPNRAEISGQTLEWLHAFADNAVNNDNVIVEIRVDRSASFEVQQKRLKMLYKILADNGVEQHKVNILFTNREPNSFIIRNVRYATDEERIEATKHSDNPWY